MRTQVSFKPQINSPQKLTEQSTAAQNRSISEPVKDTHAETIELRRKLENHQKDKVATQKLQKRFESLRKQIDNLKLELDAKVLHCDKITEERDELRQKFEEAILDVQQKASTFHFLHDFLVKVDQMFILRYMMRWTKGQGNIQK